MASLTLVMRSGERVHYEFADPKQCDAAQGLWSIAHERGITLWAFLVGEDLQSFVAAEVVGLVKNYKQPNVVSLVR